MTSLLAEFLIGFLAATLLFGFIKRRSHPEIQKELPGSLNNWRAAVKICNALLGVFLLIRIGMHNELSSFDFVILSYLCLYNFGDMFYRDGQYSTILYFFRKQIKNTTYLRKKSRKTILFSRTPF